MCAVDFNGSVKSEGYDIAHSAGDFELLCGDQSFRRSLATYVNVDRVGGGKLLFTCIQESELGERTAFILAHQLGREHVAPIEGHSDADNLR